MMRRARPDRTIDKINPSPNSGYLHAVVRKASVPRKMKNDILETISFRRGTAVGLHCCPTTETNLSYYGCNLLL